MPECIGLVAGEGELPAILARAMTARGLDVVAVALCEQASLRLQPLVGRLYSFGAGQGNKIIAALKGEGVRDLVIIGKVSKEVLFQRWRFDSRVLRVLSRARSFQDDVLLAEVIREFESEGMHVVEQSRFIPDRCPQGGILTRRRPTRREWRDIEYGFSAARSVGTLGIGQTIVVKHGVVLAVEGMEGTDETIARGCRLAQAGAVVVKVSRPGQDPRLDMPTVGLNTLEVMRTGRATVLAIEAGKTLVVEGDAFIQAADDAGISAVAG
ncbi:MAG: LpxI family protein [Candidatus Entotheonellia bacterium]